jgi:phosphatidylserine/phosphatidylglycerophosphate/cardiolipin synthase-like enzyme
MKLRTLLLGAGFALFFVTAQAVDPQVYFSRTDPVAKVLTREIDAAQKSIHLLIYALTDDELAAALLRAAQRGVDVRIVIDRTQAAGSQSLDEQLVEKLGTKRVLYRTGKGRGVMHEKMAIYDGLTVSLGSYNWAENARDNNWENLILLRDAAVAARCEAEFQRVWTSPAPKESKPKAGAK